MSDDRKHIDRLFQEKLKDFEAKPSSSVWENIETKMEFEEKDIKVIPLWAKLSGVVAGLLLLFTLGNTLINSSKDQPNTNQIVETETDTNDPVKNSQNKKDGFDLNSGKKNAVVDFKDDKPVNEKLNPSEERDFEQTEKQTLTQDESQRVATITQNNKSVSNKKTKNATLNKQNTAKNTVAGNTSINKNNTKIESETIKIVKGVVDSEKGKLAENTNVKDDHKKVAENDKLKNDEFKTDKTTTLNSDKLNETKTEDIEDAIAAIEEIEEEDSNTAESKINRWGIAPNIAPVYFNTLGTGSSINEQFNNNKKTGEVNMSYGILSSYAVNDKLSVRAGVNKLNLGYKTNNIIVYNNVNPQPETQPLRNVELSSEGQQLSFISAENFAFAQVPNIISDQINGSIDQKLGFIEVPLEVEYKISDRKMGLRLIGGFSTFFLNENEVYSNFDGNNTYIGKATNINNTSYSANLGLGVDFKLSKTLNLNLEPTFKYQINTFNNTTGNFNPFIVGVYTGIRYKF